MGYAIDWKRYYLFQFKPHMVLEDSFPPILSDYRVIYPCEINALSSKNFSRREPEFLEMKTLASNGDLLGVILKDDIVVHRSLVRTFGYGRVEGDKRSLSILSGQIYIHYCRTLKDHEGKGLYTQMLRTILKINRENPGFREALITCNQENIPSIKGILRAGFRYKSSLFVLSFAGGRYGKSFYYQGVDPTILFASDRI
jgi:RimJ/RimL family protein N-acetyltransferase